MVSTQHIVHYLTHPYELRAVIRWKLWHEPVHTRDEANECDTLKECFFYLDKTSRSFAAVIKELNPELLVPICLFYLILRGLDTIEDDMEIPIEEKEPILRTFDKSIETPGWSYNGNGSREKDRELLVRFECVVAETMKLKEQYRVIIKDITKRMGNGMADYCINRDHNLHGIQTISEYTKYCHYVAGLVGEGLTRLFVEAKAANPALLERSDLHESMGQFLQQTNIIRDIREDYDDKRCFWPKEIWSRHVDKFEDLLDPKNEDKALACSSDMILLALHRVEDCMFYLAGIRDQSTFNFCAIPQTMAIATLDLCFQNPAMFQRNIKITRGRAADLMLRSTQDLKTVYEVFREYGRSIHKQNNPLDPNFLEISAACARIEVFIEGVFSTQNNSAKGLVKKPERTAASTAMSDFWTLVLPSVGFVLLLTAFMFLIVWYVGARFDLAMEDLKNGNYFNKPTIPGNVHQLVDDKPRNEL